jgi:dipeptide/tripeptide permease
MIFLGTTLMGLGIGFAFASMANLIVEAVDRTKTSVATAMNTIMRTIGGSLGAQITATVVAGHVVAGTSFPAETGFTIAFTLSAVAVAFAFIAALAIPSRLPYAARPHKSVPGPPATAAAEPVR